MTSSAALPSPRASTPRTIAAGTRRALPSTSSAAPAISSATAICVDSSRCPLASVVPRRSRSGTMPATPSATSVVPCRQARPNESLTTTPTSAPESSDSRVRNRRAEASGSTGSRTRRSSPGVFDASTPAEAQTKPCRVSAITSGGRERTTSRLSRRITSARRASPSSPASSIARADGSTSASRTTRPSTFETAFWATTTTSPSCSPPAAPAAAWSRRPRSSPSTSSGSPSSGMTLTVPAPATTAQRTPVRRMPACAL